MLKQQIRSMLDRLMRKRIDERALLVCEINLKRDEVSFFNLSTNKILSFAYEGALWYFRECPPILGFDAYWKKAISDFFDSLDRLHISQEHFSQEAPIVILFDQDQIIHFKAYIDDKWQRDAGFRRALKAIDRTAKQMRFSIWDQQVYNQAFFESFSLGDLPLVCRDIAVYFLWNMRALAENYRKQDIVRGNTYSFFSATKAVATQIVAEELGLEHMITASKWCRLSIDGENSYFGLMSASAPGHRMLDVQIPPNPSLQKELLDLNLLDVLCHQPDHGPNNYSVHIDGQGRCSVCAFDNDNAQTFFPWPSASLAGAGCSPLVSRRKIYRPYLIKSTAERLQQIDVRHLKKRLQPYLNALQIAALRCRLHVLQVAIRKTKKASPSFLLEDDAWNEETVNEELSGRYGQTYLSKGSAISQV